MSFKMVLGEDYPRGTWMLDSYPLLDSSGYEHTATVSGVVTNLIANPRVANNTVGWGYSAGTGGAATQTRQTTGGPFNWAYTELTWTTLPSGGSKRFTLPEVSGVTPGDKYTFSAWLRTSEAVSVGLLLDYYNPAGGFVSLENNIQMRTLNDFTLVTLTGTIPAGASRVVPMIQLGGSINNGLRLAATGAMLTKTASALPYFDGDTPGPNYNYVPNPEGAPNDWQGRWFGGGSSAGTMTEVVGPTPVGNKFKRKTWTVKGTTGGDTGFDIIHNIPVAAGRTYTASGWMRPSASHPTRRLYAGIYWYKADNSIIRTGGQNAKVGVAGEWQYVVTTAVAPAGAVRAGMQLDVQGGAAETWEVGDTLDGTGAVFNEGDTAIPVKTSYSYDSTAWTGTPHASTSTQTSLNWGPSLAKGAERSLIINNSNKLKVTTTVFKQGFEYRPFSIEAIVRPIESSAGVEQQIFGNEGVMDGLVLNGNVISFVTKYEDGSEARASFDLMDPQSFGVVGVHTERKNILYINGDQVAEVEITPAQQAGKYVASGNTQSCGSSAGTNSFMMNALSFYDLELDEESAMIHYANGQDTLGAEDVAIDYKGALLEFAPEGALAPFFSIEYSSDSEWNSLGHRVNCAINDGTLYPAVSQGISIAGYWETVVPLGQVPNNIYAANLLWEGTGATVATSRDGIEWTPAQKGRALTTVPKGTSGTDEYLYIRVSFPGGKANDLSSFDNMVFSLYSTGTISNFSGREVILDKVTPEDDLDVIDYHQNWGAEMEGGTITIKSAVGDMGIKARTIEVWAQKGNSGTFTDNLGTAARVRSNGGAFKPYANGEWQLRHYVFDSAFTGDIVFSGTGQIGHVVLYPETLSDAVIKEIYDSYTGKPRIQVEVDEVFDIHEFNGQVDIYEYDWSIESSG